MAITKSSSRNLVHMVPAFATLAVQPTSSDPSEKEKKKKKKTEPRTNSFSAVKKPARLSAPGGGLIETHVQKILTVENEFVLGNFGGEKK